MGCGFDRHASRVDQIFLHVSRKGIKNERTARGKSQHHKERTLVMAEQSRQRPRLFIFSRPQLMSLRAYAATLKQPRQQSHQSKMVCASPKP